MGQGHDIPESNGGQCGDGEVEGIAKISHLRICQMFCLVEQPRRHKKDDQNGQQQPEHIQKMDADVAEEKIGVGGGKTQEPENSEYPETTDDFKETDANGNAECVGNQKDKNR